MLTQMSLLDTDSSTSSQGSADGPSPVALLVGPTVAKSSPVRARASRSRSRAKVPELLMNGIYGPTFSESSTPCGPLSSWENRLRLRLARVGSSECDLTWKVSGTTPGESLSRLVPSTPRTVEIDSGLLLEAAYWVTCTTRDHKDTPGMSLVRPDGRSRVDQLPRQVAATLAAGLYPTPTASGFEATDAARLMERREKCKESTGNGNGFGLTLGQFACLESAMWPTPCVPNGGRSPKGGMSITGMTPDGIKRQVDLQEAARQITGQAPAGSAATTAKRGVLNPAFPCWLMGYPLAHLSCGATAMQSFRKSPPK